MFKLVIVMALLAGCGGDDEARKLPLCVELGCENAFCDRAGICSCNGQTCMQCGQDRPDAGVCAGPDASPAR